MMTPPDGRSDGNKINYLSQPAKWRHRDPVLFDALKDAVDCGRRQVSALQDAALLSKATFYSQILLDDAQARTPRV